VHQSLSNESLRILSCHQHRHCTQFATTCSAFACCLPFGSRLSFIIPFVQSISGLTLLSQGRPNTTSLGPNSMTRNPCHLMDSPIWSWSQVKQMILPAWFLDLSILYRGISQTRRCIQILFSFTNLSPMNRVVAPQFTIAAMDVFQFQPLRVTSI